ncbi:3-hydroxyacyl-ACP dehydratase FabZ [Prauserella halophila]|uniref:3-hydroxyacyl-ACP dehydratase FabZ n=1 Tax=Prauserella halophila TaxID=185641 RepID=A0ABP4GQ13_9PSEU|nr:beta-hydroxyacyl-ACP dehydratase [Prauserella halophila]MCP2235313.1 3-hydroxyacyl-[acyl-carrier-protein] dehydratase [Prauserella halophila]
MTVETPDTTVHTTQAPLEHADLKRILAHRHPILQLDRVVEFEPGRRIVAIKAVTGTEPCYGGLSDDAVHADHAYPASLLMESMGQASAALWLHSAILAGEQPRGTLVFGSAREFTIEGAAYPGDVLRHIVELDSTKGDNAFMHGETWAGDRRIVTADSMLVALRDDMTLT